jgi:hypothetical protein
VHRKNYHWKSKFINPKWLIKNKRKSKTILNNTSSKIKNRKS